MWPSIVNMGIVNITTCSSDVHYSPLISLPIIFTDLVIVKLFTL